jgi:hypothetical protein
MNIKEALDAEHSKALTLGIINYVGDDADRMAELMDCFFSDHYRLCQRASWAVGYMAEKNPKLIEPYLERIILNLNNPVHDAIMRNTMRVFRDLPTIPDDLLGITAGVCFRYVTTPSVAVAIRSFAMRVLEKICKKVPELKEELRLTLEDLMQYETAPAFKSAAKDVLKRI